MSIEKIVERIDIEAAGSVEGILREAGERAAVIRKEYARQAVDLEKDLEAGAAKKAAETEKHLVVGEQLELKKALLAKKREILTRIYDEAKKRIEGLSAEDSARIIRELILRNAVTGREEIVVSSGQSGICTREFLDSLNKAFTGGGSFKLADDKGRFTWGVVLREGRRVVDLSLDVIFEQLKEKVEPGLAAMLFSETGRED